MTALLTQLGTSAVGNPLEFAALFQDEIDARTLKNYIDAGYPLQLLDVRETREFERGALHGSLSIPLNGLLARTDEIAPNVVTIVICRSGQRSARAIADLKRVGFVGQLLNLKGGLLAWARDVDVNFPR